MIDGGRAVELLGTLEESRHHLPHYLTEEELAESCMQGAAEFKV